MGKPSHSNIAQSKKSVRSLSNKHDMKHKRGHKEKHKKGHMDKTNLTIKKVFEKLRNKSLNNTSSVENTVVDTGNKRETQSSNSHKRKLSPHHDSVESIKHRKLSNSNNSCIVIEDEPGESTQTPQNTPHKPKTNTIHCSTPIVKKNSADLRNLIVSNFNNNNASLVQNFHEEVNDLTKEINGDSYITIDLTKETNRTARSNAVIDLGNTHTEDDCTVISISEGNLSLSGESNITVLNMSNEKKKQRQMQQIVNGISKLDKSGKQKLLEVITENIFNGCSAPKRLRAHNANNDQASSSKATEVQDIYIKEVIVGQTPSRNSIGSNIYNPERDARNKTGLRMVIIDGSNVAMEHGKGKEFSVKGLKICIDYFLKRGHVVKAFVPRFRCKFGKSTDPRQLDDLERKGLVVYTPSREVQGRLITSYDDRYIVQCAAEFDGVIVSGDNFRDLLKENPRWRTVIENRLLPFTWVQDMIMFPRDPLGRNGPTLEEFLKHPTPKIKV